MLTTNKLACYIWPRITLLYPLYSTQSFYPFTKCTK